MMPSWPAELPLPNRENYQFDRTDGRLKSKMDAGPARYRLMSSAIVEAAQLAITVDRDGKEIFDAFYRDETAYGTKPFWMPDPTTDGWAIFDEDGVPLLDGDGSPLLFSETWLCMFGEKMPSETIIGIRFNITFSVGIMP